MSTGFRYIQKNIITETEHDVIAFLLFILLEKPREKCVDCNVTFGTHFELMKHRLTNCILNRGISITSKNNKNNEPEINEVGEPYVDKVYSYTCKYCGKIEYKSSNLIRHLGTSCRALPAEMRDQAIQQQRLQFNGKRRFFHCKPCKLRFGSHEAMKKHCLTCIKKVSDELSKRCKHCAKPFSTPFNLRRHEKTCKIRFAKP